MQPSRGPARPAHMLRVVRAFAALSLALGLSAVPLTTVQACSCVPSALPDAAVAADVAFVGTSLGSTPAGRDEMGERVITTWVVERSRDPIDGSRIDVGSHADSGANCGISFADGERWLVLADSALGALITSGCAQNRILDGADAEAEAVIAELLTEVPRAEEPGPAPIEIPAPVIGIGLAAIVVVAASIVAFRRERS
jgi:hypothetical protein